MANNKFERLFEEFPEVSTEAWEAVITTDLKGADYQKKLVWRTAEGFNVRPYYRAEDLKDIQWLGTTAGQFPYVRGVKNCNRWKVFQTICVNDAAEANAKALHAIESGVCSVGFHIENELSAEQVNVLLAGIDPTKNEVVFCSENEWWIVEPVMAWAAQFSKEDTRIAFNFDPIMWGLSAYGTFCCGCDKGTPCFEKLAGYIKEYAEWKHVRFVGVDGSLLGNSGSTIVEELGYMLAAGHDYVVRLMEQGVSATAAAKSLRFTTSITANYFMEIAKLRAARLLWANIMRAYEPECSCAEKIYLHAVTSMWNQTVYDSYVNMLRGTTELCQNARQNGRNAHGGVKNTRYESCDHARKKSHQHRRPNIPAVGHEHGTHRHTRDHGSVHRQVCKIQYFICNIDTDRHNTPNESLGYGSRHCIQ